MISVIIPTFRNELRLRDLLSSLERQSVSVPVEILVIANLPKPGLKKTVESFGARYYETGRIGVNLARNKGLSLAKGSLVVFLDDDVYISDTHYLERHLTAHEEHPEACAIGGPFLPKSNLSDLEAAYHWLTHHALLSHRRERLETTRLSGGNFSIKAASLEGEKFDDRITFGSSEASFFARLRRSQNLFLLLDSLAVEHRVSMSWLSFARRAFFQGYGDGLMTAMQMPERPHWAAGLPLEETLRRSHAEPSRRLRLAIRLYKRFYAHGFGRGAHDSDTYVASSVSKKIVYKRPEFSFLTIASAVVAGRWRTSLLDQMKDQAQAFKAAIRL